MNVLQRWFKKSTTEEKIALAKLALTTVANLRQVAGGFRTSGELRTTPESAARIERASIKLAREGLPELHREDLCAACGKCELAKIARRVEKDQQPED